MCALPNLSPFIQTPWEVITYQKKKISIEKIWKCSELQ